MHNAHKPMLKFSGGGGGGQIFFFHISQNMDGFRQNNVCVTVCEGKKEEYGDEKRKDTAQRSVVNASNIGGVRLFSCLL